MAEKFRLGFDLLSRDQSEASTTGNPFVDRVVHDISIREAVGKLGPPFGFADRVEEATGKYVGLTRANALLYVIASSAVIVRPEVVLEPPCPSRVAWKSTPAVPLEGER